jgi:hypothetical protein
MLNVGHMTERTCQGLSRRQMLQVGGLGAVGLSLEDLLRAQASAAGSGSAKSNDEKACIFLWLNGGPSHFETFDPKPKAPDNIRGPYGATATNVPGVQISELMPMTARILDRVAIIRSMTSPSGGHSPIPMMTAFPGERTSHGAVLTKLKGFTKAMPPYVHIGPRLGVGGGDLGSPYNPAEVPIPGGKKVEMPQFSLSANISVDRFRQRQELLSSIDRVRADLSGNLSVEKMNSFYRLAVDMLTSSKVRKRSICHPNPNNSATGTVRIISASLA